MAEEAEVEDDVDLDDDIRDGKVLMVDQLWLWSINTGKLWFPA
jgi:hypothetical protein